MDNESPRGRSRATSSAQSATGAQTANPGNRAASAPPSPSRVPIETLVIPGTEMIPETRENEGESSPSRTVRRPRSPSRSPSRSSTSSYSREKFRHWELHGQYWVPIHGGRCGVCSDYLNHIRAADEAQNESFEDTYEEATERHARKTGKKIIGLEARLDECHRNRDRDAERYERLARDSAKDRANYDTARSECALLREQIAVLETKLAAARQTANPAPIPTIAPTGADTSSRAPATTQDASRAPLAPPPNPIAPRTALVSRLGGSANPPAATPGAGPSRPGPPRPAPAGDEALARRVFESQGIEFDEDWFEMARIEEEAEQEAREERSGGKTRKKGKGRADTYAAAAATSNPASRNQPPPTTGEKRKTAPTSPDGVRPTPAAPARNAATSSYRPSPGQIPPYTRQPPPEPGNWTLVHGRHWFDDDGSEGFRLWVSLTEREITSIFSTSQNREVGPITRQQLLLVQARAPSDRNYRSKLQALVSRYVADLGNNTTHPVVRPASRSPGVLMGQNGVYNHVDYGMQLFFHALQRMHDSFNDGYTRHYAALNRAMRSVLARPGEYDRLVLQLYPDSPDASPTETRLQPEYAFNVGMFAEPSDITKLDAVRYMWETLRIPRSVANSTLELFARRLARHNIAMDVLRGMILRDRNLPEDQRSLQGITEGQAMQAFRARSGLAFTVRSVSVYASTPIVFWPVPSDWMMTTTDQVDVSMDWLPESIRTEFETEYRSRVAQQEG
ncbi:hypothetical protein FRC12_010770 [Ceratobasidium sp. 428]|nr:hypothetical protein FRC12_010770 [Ceratobasidium sp. 428]